MTKQMKTATSTARPDTPARKLSVKTSPAPKTKLGQLEGMLRRAQGATLTQMAKTLAWQAHSVRGAMSGALKKKQGLNITTSKPEGGERVYRIVAGKAVSPGA